MNDFIHERGLRPNPGSQAAVAAGCTCTIIDNSHGKGINGDGAKYGWWIIADCPLHGRAALEWAAQQAEPSRQVAGMDEGEGRL